MSSRFSQTREKYFLVFDDATSNKRNLHSCDLILYDCYCLVYIFDKI